MLPSWLLRDVDRDAQGDRRFEPESPSEPSASTVLTFEYLKLWIPACTSPDPGLLERFPSLRQQFQAACELEILRRNGVLRVHVAGEDRLDREVPRSIEINPVILAELGKRGLPPPEEGDLFQHLTKLTHLARETDWADLEASGDEVEE